MRGGLAHGIAALAAACFALPVVRGAETEAPVGPPTFRERIDVQTVVWPAQLRVTKRGEAGDCQSLAPDSIRVTEDGVEARVTLIERERKPTIHAILIDTSGSMAFNERLQQAKLAALRYAVQLRDDESAMLMTFDDHLMLRYPLTRLDVEGARDELNRAIESIALGGYTQMRDALFQSIRLLSGFPERKVVLLLTDGHDTMSRQSPATVRGLAASAPHQNLTIFPIGLQLPDRQRQRPLPSSGGSIVRHQPLLSQGILVRPFLYDMADNTGGIFFEVREPTQLASVFQEIRDHLNREVYLHYRPQPYGEGPRDRPDADYVFRRVKIRSDDRRCEVLSFKPDRFVPAEDAPQPLPGADPRRTDEGVFPLPSRVGIPFPAGWSGEASGGSFLLLEPGRIVGRTVDLVQEWGHLVLPPEHAGPAALAAEGGGASGPGGDGGIPSRAELHRDWNRQPDPRDPTIELSYEKEVQKLQQQASATETLPLDEAEFASRLFLMDLAPLAHTMRRDVSSPEDALYYWLLNNIHPELPPTREHDERIRNVIHGRTFLEIRPYLAMAIFDHYPDYRRWALGRLRHDLRRELNAALAGASPELIDELLEARLERPTPREIQRYLSSWLGDLRAVDVVELLERRMINELLRASPEMLSQVRAVARGVERGWPALRFWFRPPDRVRVIVPMLLFYDPRREQAGFIRIVMPRLGPDGTTREQLPETPAALQLARRLLDDPALAYELRGRWEVEAVSRERARREDLVPKRRRRKGDGVEVDGVRLTLRGTAGESRGEQVDLLVFERARNAGKAPRELCADGSPSKLLGMVRKRLDLPACSVRFGESVLGGGP